MATKKELEQIKNYHQIVTLEDFQYVGLINPSDRILEIIIDKGERQEEVFISDTETVMLPISKIIELLQK